MADKRNKWEILKQDYLDLLNALNPWLVTGRVPGDLAKPRRRAFADSLWRAIMDPALRRFQLVIGARRVGKTVAMYQAVQQLIEHGVEPNRLWWLHLAHPLLMSNSLGEWVEALVQHYKPSDREPLYVFLDELTYARDWDLWLKTFYDEQWPIRVVGSSSSTAALRQRRVESGVGRWEEYYLTPCLFNEYLFLRNRDVPEPRIGPTLSESLHEVTGGTPEPADLNADLRRYLFIGGFPELLMEDEPARPAEEPELFPAEQPDLESVLFRTQRVLRDDMILKSVYQDIPQAFNMQSPMDLERLLCILAGQVGGLMSPATLAGDVGLSAPTVSKYLSYLERSFLVFLVPNYAPREETVQRRGRKVYFVDAAVRNAALQRGLAPLRDHTEFGLLLENVVAAHLHALSLHAGARLYHWRDGRQEVDFVYEDTGGPVAIEVASSPGHHRRGLKALQQKHPKLRGRCYVVSQGTRPRPPSAEDGTPGRLPVELFLLLVGAQAQHALEQRWRSYTNEK